MLEVRDLADAALAGLFLFGLLFTLASVLFGVVGHGVHHPRAHGHVSARGQGRERGGPMSIGFSNVLLFLTWLGGIAFVLRRAADWPLVAALPVAALAGAAVASLMQVAIRKLSDPTGSVLEPEQFRLPGTIGRLSGAIRAGGTGEIVYEQGGVRQVSAARVADGRELPRGTEVIVLRVERGIATVEPFDAFASLDRDAALDAPLAERRPG